MGDRPNKSQGKREMAELLDIAKRLADVEVARLRAAGLSERTVVAVEHLGTLHHRGSILRQLRFIRGLLTNEDLGPILQFLDDEGRQGRRGREAFHRLEAWRDRLVADDQGVWDELLQAMPGLDRQQLRNLARNARREAAAASPPRAARTIFRILREAAGE